MDFLLLRKGIKFIREDRLRKKFIYIYEIKVISLLRKLFLLNN